MLISFFKNSVLRPKSLLLRKQLFTLFSLPQRNTKPLKQGLQKSNLFCTEIQQNTELFDVFSKKYINRHKRIYSLMHKSFTGFIKLDIGSPLLQICLFHQFLYLKQDSFNFYNNGRQPGVTSVPR